MAKIKRTRRIRIFAFLFLGIVRDFYKETRLARRHGLNTARKRMARRHRKRAIQLRNTALKMGGVLIKLGQFFSSRVDVMPEEYIEELAKLQDMVPPVDFEEIKSLIEDEFGKPLDKIFKTFEPESKAAASLAQVHFATLPDSTEVAVKVQRPNIEKLIDIDLATFSYLMDGVERFTSFGKKVDISRIVTEFERTLGDELDFIREGNNAERFRVNFKDTDNIFIPKTYEKFSTNKVLTLERVGGIKISDYEALEKNGIDRSKVAQEVAQSYFKQVLEDGFFHADPHPGNLFALKGPIINFVDFGMVGEISEEIKANLRDLIVAVGVKDVDRIVSAFIKLGFLRRGAGSYSVKNAIKWMLDNYSSITTNTLSIEDIEEINEDLKKIMRDEPFTIPAEYAFLGRAIGTLHGLTIGLDPNFDIVDSITPYVKNITVNETQNAAQIILKETVGIFKTLVAMPQKIEELLSSASKGTLKVKVDAKDIVRSLDRIYTSQINMALSMISTVFVLASIFLLNLGFRVESYIGFSLGLILVVYLIFGGRRKRKKYF
ncbi:hypothetical protein LCGC14_1018050 [marine sediment metagenome]|uniref:ABC1 atypical kinase-like domain-containing protein n=1 Tax=marine sediment metagenome TaxID=412755 RepID=A0A0F9NJX8_9ZZZZ|nr:AarF/ABC1/UbiB kinase family protein [Actinomycetota bacterium]